MSSWWSTLGYSVVVAVWAEDDWVSRSVVAAVRSDVVTVGVEVTAWWSTIWNLVHVAIWASHEPLRAWSVSGRTSDWSVVTSVRSDVVAIFVNMSAWWSTLGYLVVLAVWAEYGRLSWSVVTSIRSDVVTLRIKVSSWWSTIWNLSWVTIWAIHESL